MSYTLYDDGASDPSSITRDYVFKLDTAGNGSAAALSIYGGKITTYRKLAELLIKLRLPSIGNPSAGYLLSYGVSSPAVARLAAKQVDQILKGAKPADIPVEQVSTFELEINVRTAKAIGLSIP